jgi:predicted metal-dependent hydrolase
VPLPKIIRSRRKTIALIIQADGSLLVRAPQRASNRQIAEILEEKSDWISARLAQAMARPKPEQHHFTSGEQFWYLGRTWPLLEAPGTHDRLEFSGGQFKLSLPTFPVPTRSLREAAGRTGKARVLFETWYRRQARQVFEERAALLARRCGFSYRRVKITSARTRWGSCSTLGTLSFTWRLVMAPLAVIDYVVMHELVHTVTIRHGRDFWERVQALVPEYKQYVAWLKENGALLEI